MRLKERIYSVEGLEAIEPTTILSYVFLGGMAQGITAPSRYSTAFCLDHDRFGSVFERLNMFVEVPFR